MSRPGDWQVVGRLVDPTPGDAWGARAVAGVYGRTVTAASQVSTLVRAVQSTSGSGVWDGKAGDAFRNLLGEFPAQVAACERSYRTAQEAMSWWAGRMEDHQSSADRALEQARAADGDLRAAQTALEAALSGAQAASSNLAALELDAARYKNVDPLPRGVSLPTPRQLSAARVASRDAASSQTDASNRVGDAQGRLDAASRLVTEAAMAYEADAATAVTRLGAAHDQALAENSIWEKVRSSGAWSALVAVATVVAAVAGIVALFLTGPIAILVLVVSVVASVVLMADAAMAALAGQGSWWGVLLASLAFVPGGVLLRSGRSIVSTATWIGVRIAPSATTAATNLGRTAALYASNGLGRLTLVTRPYVDGINRALTRGRWAAGAQVGEPTGKVWVFPSRAGNPGFTVHGQVDPHAFRTKPNEAYFWSGRTNGVGVEKRAAEVATERGGTTLELLVKDRGFDVPLWSEDLAIQEMWKEASAAFADGASGDVHAVLGRELRDGNVWQNVEIPRLRENENVLRIIEIDSTSGAEAIVSMQEVS